MELDDKRLSFEKKKHDELVIQREKRRKTQELERRRERESDMEGFCMMMELAWKTIAKSVKRAMK